VKRKPPIWTFMSGKPRSRRSSPSMSTRCGSRPSGWTCPSIFWWCPGAATSSLPCQWPLPAPCWWARLDMAVIRRLASRPLDTLLATLGVSLILRQAAPRRRGGAEHSWRLQGGTSELPLMLLHGVRQTAYLQRHYAASAAMQHTSNCVYGRDRMQGRFLSTDVSMNTEARC